MELAMKGWTIDMKKLFYLYPLFIIAVILSQTVFAQIPDPNQESSPTQSLTKEDRIFGLVTIYQAAKQHFAYFEQVPQLDWDVAFKEYLPLVEKEQSLLEYYRTLQKFTALLEDGHTQVYLPDELKHHTDNLPIILGYIEERWIVIERWPTDEILAEDMPPGTVLLEIDGVDTNEYIQNKIFPYVAHGTIQGKRDRVNWVNFFPIEDEVKIRLCYPNGTMKTRVIKANRKSANWTPENREKYFAKLRKGPDFLTEKLDGDSLYIRFRKCNSECEDRFVSLIESFDTWAPSVIILDLRENGGGNTPQKTITHLISKRISGRYSKTRCSISSLDASIKMALKSGVTEEQFSEQFNEAKEKGELPKGYIPGWLVSEPGYIEPAEKHYKGQIVILIDVTTGSAAEDMASKLKVADHVKIIGEPTNGSTGTPMFYDLPGGGQLRVCTINTPLSGVGVQPDILVNRTIKGIASGKDEILEAAQKFILDLIEKEQGKNNKKADFVVESNAILHIAPRCDWDKAIDYGEYRPESLNTAGYIHCSKPSQIIRVANHLFKGQKGLVLLVIDPRKVKSEIKWEGKEQANLYPHIYGSLNLDAVKSVLDFPPSEDGTFELPEQIHKIE
jgi:carboxyl-terminal processing protease